MSNTFFKGGENFKGYSAALRSPSYGPAQMVHHFAIQLFANGGI